jgi:hypothetical protein
MQKTEIGGNDGKTVSSGFIKMMISGSQQNTGVPSGAWLAVFEA